MPDKDAANPVAAALSYLRTRNQFLKFDSQERVVEVSISGTSNTDDLAAHIGNLHDLRKLTFWRTDLTDISHEASPCHAHIDSRLFLF